MAQGNADWKEGAASDTIRVVIDLIPRFYRTVATALAQAGDPVALPARTHYRILGILVQCPGISLTDLASRVGMTKTNASPLVEKLVQEGLVTRSPHPEDRRVQCLGLTALGRGSFNQGLVRLTEGLSRRFEVLNPDEGARLTEALSVLVEILPKVL